MRINGLEWEICRVVLGVATVGNLSHCERML